MHSTIAWYAGYCAGCTAEQPLVLVEHGPRGLRAWLSGFGAEDRTLSYCCRVCGRDEHVPLTEADDRAYEETLARWPDTFLVPVPVPVAVPVAEHVVVDLVTREPVDLPLLMAELALDVADAEAEADLVDAALQLPALAARRRAAARPVVRVLALPVQRVSATDLALPVSA